MQAGWTEVTYMSSAKVGSYWTCSQLLQIVLGSWVEVVSSVSQQISVVVLSSSHVWLFVTPWTAACQASLSLTISWSLPKFMFIASVMPSSHLIFWCSLLLPFIFPSNWHFSRESSIYIRWPKHWSFSFSINSSTEYSGLISLKIDCFDLLAVQRTFRGFLQHQSSKA